MAKAKPFNYSEWLKSLVPGCLVKFGQGYKPAEVIGRTEDDWTQIVVALEKKHYYFHAASGRQCTESKVRFGEYSLYPWTPEDDALLEQAKKLEEEQLAKKLEAQAEAKRLEEEKEHAAELAKQKKLVADVFINRMWGAVANNYCSQKYDLCERYSKESLERINELIATVPLLEEEETQENG